MLARGRPVRCAQCGEKWLPAAEPGQATEPAPEPGSEQGRAREPERAQEPERSGPVAAVPAAQAGFDPPRPPRSGVPIEGAFTRLGEGPLARLAPPPIVRRNIGWGVVGWIGTIALLATLGWAAITWRADVMQRWPPSERLYAALGLDP